MDAISEEFYIPEIAVAAVDILGFKKLAMRPDDCRKAMRVLARCVGNASEARMYSSTALNGPFEMTHAEDNYFGDSIYLFSDPHLEMRVQILRLMDLVPEDSFFR